MSLDVVSLSAYPKSGITYLSFLIFHSLFPDGCDVHRIESEYVVDIHAYPDTLFAERGTAFIKSHFPCHSRHPFINRTAKAIYLLRHPMDVMMSAWDYKYLTDSRKAPDPEEVEEHAFRAYVRRWIETGGTAFPEYGSWVEHVRSWLNQRDIPVHLVMYRNLVDQPDSELSSILSFLGAEVSGDRQRAAVKRSSMKAMAALEAQEVESRTEGVFFRKHLTPGFDRGHRFINKGYRGTYDTVLTDEERAFADATFGAELKRYFASLP